MTPTSKHPTRFRLILLAPWLLAFGCYAAACNKQAVVAYEAPVEAAAEDEAFPPPEYWLNEASVDEIFDELADSGVESGNPSFEQQANRTIEATSSIAPMWLASAITGQ